MKFEPPLFFSSSTSCLQIKKNESNGFSNRKAFHSLCCFILPFHFATQFICSRLTFLFRSAASFFTSHTTPFHVCLAFQCFFFFDRHFPPHTFSWFTYQYVRIRRMWVFNGATRELKITVQRLSKGRWLWFAAGKKERWNVIVVNVENQNRFEIEEILSLNNVLMLTNHKWPHAPIHRRVKRISNEEWVFFIKLYLYNAIAGTNERMNVANDENRSGQFSANSHSIFSLFSSVFSRSVLLRCFFFARAFRWFGFVIAHRLSVFVRKWIECNCVHSMMTLAAHGFGR